MPLRNFKQCLGASSPSCLEIIPRQVAKVCQGLAHLGQKGNKQAGVFSCPKHSMLIPAECNVKKAEHELQQGSGQEQQTSAIACQALC